MRTIHGRGFRFVGDVQFAAVPAMPVSEQPAPSDSVALRPPDDKRPAIAILPFTPMGLDGPYSAIPDAIPAELIATLTRLRWLKVIAPGSSFRFRSDSADIETIGAALGVGYILSGTVEMFDRKITLSIELTDARSGHVVWAERLAGEIEDIHTLREHVVGLITSVLEMQISRNESEIARLRSPKAFDAWAASIDQFFTAFPFEDQDRRETLRQALLAHGFR